MDEIRRPGGRIPEEYGVLSREELAARLGMPLSSLATYLARRVFSKVPAPDGRLGQSPFWYELTVREWERTGERPGEGAGRAAGGTADEIVGGAVGDAVGGAAGGGT